MRDAAASRALFWREAAKSLPAQVQARYAGYFESAEQWELALDRAIELASRVGRSFGRRTQTQAA
jgi:hypothetical protein